MKKMTNRTCVGYNDDSVLGGSRPTLLTRIGVAIHHEGLRGGDGSGRHEVVIGRGVRASRRRTGLGIAANVQVLKGMVIVGLRRDRH
jgi:hypothetical protein